MFRRARELLIGSIDSCCVDSDWEREHVSIRIKVVGMEVHVLTTENPKWACDRAQDTRLLWARGEDLENRIKSNKNDGNRWVHTPITKTREG